MLGRRALQLGLVALVVTVVLGLLSTFEVGIDVPEFDESAPLEERIETTYEIDREFYLTWGAWADVSTMVVFASVLVAAPFLVGVRRSLHLLVAGTAIAVVGDLIDISKLVGYEIADFGLEEGLAASFTAGNVFRFAIDVTSTHVWVGGLALAALGLFTYAVEAPSRRLGRASGMLGVALLAMAATDLWGSGQLFEVTSWITAAVAAYWFATAIPTTSDQTMVISSSST